MSDKSVEKLYAAISASPEAERPRAALAYLCGLVGSLNTRGITADSLQAVITEIHCTCMNVDPTLDDDSPRFDGLPSPPLLHEAVSILQKLVDTEPNNGLSARAQAVLERADPIVNPATQSYYEDDSLPDSEDPG